MSPISRGFRGHRPQVDGVSVPPGQHVVDDFPVLSAGSPPHRPLDAWTLQIGGAIDEPVSWTWDELPCAPRRDAHGRHPLRDRLVTARHELDGRFVDTLLA